MGADTSFRLGINVINSHRRGNGVCPRFFGATGAKVIVYAYDAPSLTRKNGQLAAEYGDGPSVSGTQYYTADHLGSTRLITDFQGAVVERLDYFPFGEGLALGVNGRSSLFPEYNAGARPANPEDGESIKFTGKERDAETALDYFLARYYSGTQGRFTSADAPFADQHPADPQSWSLYGYVRNNPLRRVDPTGAGGKEIAAGMRDGVTNFANNLYEFGRSFWNDVPGTLDAMVEDTADTLELAWDTYSTSEGRERLVNQMKSHSQQENAAIITEALLVGATTVIGARTFKGPAAAEGEGIVYLRTNPATGGEYVGQTISPGRFVARQAEHNRALGVQHEFEILGRAEPGAALDVLEETHIRQRGGIQKRGGPLENGKHQMSEERYRAAGGTEDLPY